MAFQRSLPEHYKIVDAFGGPVTTNGAKTSDYVSLKHAHKAWLILSFTQAVAHATTITIRQALNVAALDVKDHGADPAPRVWLNADVAATDTLVQQADAVVVTLPADAAKMQVVIEVDPDALDTNGGFDCVTAVLSNSAQATNFVNGTWVLATRYKAATPPSAIID